MRPRPAIAIATVFAAAVTLAGQASPGDARHQRNQPTIPRPDFEGSIEGAEPGRVLVRLNRAQGVPESARFTVRRFNLYCGQADTRQRTTFNVRKADFINRHTFDFDRVRFGYPNRYRFHGRLLPNGNARGFFSYFSEPPILDRQCHTAGRLRWRAFGTQ